MSAPIKPPPMSAEEYLAWHVTQEDRYEYVNGAPQLKHVRWDGPRMMVGATQAHSLLILNIASMLREKLRGRDCRPFAADGKVVTPRGNSRYPDVAVDCAPFSPNSSRLAQPTAVVEIWSKSTRWVDLSLKLDDYRGVDSIQSILFLSQDRYNGQLWTRRDEWAWEDLEGIEAVAALPSLGLTLDFRQVYDGLDLG